MARAAALLVIFACLVQSSSAFYLPGVASRTFKDGEEVKIKVQTVSFLRDDTPSSL